MHASLLGYWRLLVQLMADTWQRQALLVLHLPRAQVAALRRLATDRSGSSSGSSSSPGPGLVITTGDAVQAACALLLHAATGQPLLPPPPRSMSVLVQLPAPVGYFGNAAHMLPVVLPPGGGGGGRPQAVAEGDYRGALGRLAAAIRSSTVAFRRPVRPEGIMGS